MNLKKRRIILLLLAFEMLFITNTIYTDNENEPVQRIEGIKGFKSILKTPKLSTLSVPKKTKKADKTVKKKSKKAKWRSLGVFKLTSYYIGEDEWGDTIARPCDKRHKAIEGHTIAVDPNVIDYGTKVKIDGHIYIAEDCGGAVKGNVIDIYVSEPRDILKYREVFIENK